MEVDITDKGRDYHQSLLEDIEVMDNSPHGDIVWLMILKDEGPMNLDSITKQLDHYGFGRDVARRLFEAGYIEQV